MKKIVLIQSHCNTNEKIEILKKNITELRKLDVDILLFSHIMIPSEVIESVDYFVYDKSTMIVYGFFHNTQMAESRAKDLKKSNPELKLSIFPFRMNDFIEMSLKK